jgi:uncharacterized lipoprotein YddW (UPF0748 family)
VGRAELREQEERSKDSHDVVVRFRFSWVFVSWWRRQQLSKFMQEVGQGVRNLAPRKR